MKHLITTLLSIIILLPAAAQEVDTTSTVVGKKLDFDSPNFMIEDYFESVKAHMSAEGRKEWRPEFSLRTNAFFYNSSLDLTGGIRTSPNKVFGLGVGYAETFYDANPASAYRMNLFLYHRHYIPLDRKRRFSLYSDLIGGCSYTYKVTGNIQNDIPKAGIWKGYFMWEPGLSVRLWGKSNIFLGPSIGISRNRILGLHLGLAI